MRVDQFNKGKNSNYIQKYITGYDHKGKLSSFRCPNILKYQFEERGKYNYSNQCCYKLKKELLNKRQQQLNRKIVITRMESHRGAVQKGMAQTITTAGGDNVGVVVKDTENYIQWQQKVWTKYANEIDCCDYCEYMLLEDFIYFYWNNGKHLAFELKEYGKTWALTKEELEDEIFKM